MYTMCATNMAVCHKVSSFDACMYCGCRHPSSWRQLHPACLETLWGELAVYQSAAPQAAFAMCNIHWLTSQQKSPEDGQESLAWQGEEYVDALRRIRNVVAEYVGDGQKKTAEIYLDMSLVPDDVVGADWEIDNQWPMMVMHALCWFYMTVRPLGSASAMITSGRGFGVPCHV